MPWTLHIEYDNVQNQIAPLWEMVGIRFSLIFAFQTEKDNASKGSDAHSQGQLKGHRGRLTGYEILGYNDTWWTHSRMTNFHHVAPY